MGRLVAYGGLALGFWLLYLGFKSGNLPVGIPLGLAGGIIILVGMYLMVTIRDQGSPAAPVTQENAGNEEDGTGDPIDRSNKGG